MYPKIEKAENELFNLVVKFAFFYITDTEYSDGSVCATPVCIHVRNEFELNEISFRDKRHWAVLQLLCDGFSDHFVFIEKNRGKLMLSSKDEGDVNELLHALYERISHWYGQELSFEHECDGNLVDIIQIGLFNYIDALLNERINEIKKEIANRKSKDVGGLVEKMQQAYKLRHDIARIIDEITNKNNIMDKNNDEPVAMVFKTNDYDKFSFLSQNREPDHVKALISSFKERLVPNAILCNDKFQIIDGQNRFLALREMGKPILYYCIEGLDIYDVASLNSFGKNWSAMDFIKMWAELGKEQYQNILSFAETYAELNLNSILIILSDSVAAQQASVGTDSWVAKDKSRSSARNKLKLGEFQIKDINHAHYVARCIMQYKPFAKPGKQIHKQTAFVSAMVKLLRNKDFDNNELVRKAGLYPSLFYRCINANEYILMLEELWNYRRQKKIRFEY